MTEQRAEQIRGLVQDVLADADTRASLQGSGMTAGYDGGFVINSNDGNWSLKINGLLQNRFVVSHTRDNQNPVLGNAVGGLLGIPGEKTHDGFETTRAVLNFSGTVAKDYGFNVRLNWSPYAAGNTPGPSEVEWAYGTIGVHDNFDLQIGKQKMDVMRSYMVNAEFQQAIDRSLYTYYWASSSITNGIKLNYHNDNIKANVMYSNAPTFNLSALGQNVANTGQYNENPADWMLSGRVAWLASGTWDQFDQMTSPQGTEAGMLFGMGWYAGDGNDDLIGVNTGTLWALSWDASLDFGGWNIFGSLTYGDDGYNQFAQDIDGHQWGYQVQGGYYLTEDIELFGRWEWLDPRIANNGNHTNIEIMTFGANWYLAGQNAKLSIDWGYNFDQTLTSNVGGSGYADWTNSGMRNEWVLRTQLQLYF